MKFDFLREGDFYYEKNVALKMGLLRPVSTHEKKHRTKKVLQLFIIRVADQTGTENW